MERRIIGNYQILVEIGSGSHARVYHASEIRTGQVVAQKGDAPPPDLAALVPKLVQHPSGAIIAHPILDQAILHATLQSL